MKWWLLQRLLRGNFLGQEIKKEEVQGGGEEEKEELTHRVRSIRIFPVKSPRLFHIFGSISPVTKTLVGGAIFFSIVLAYYYYDLNQHSRALSTVQRGLDICFTRSNQSFMAGMLDDYTSEYLTEEFKTQTDQCFQEMVTQYQRDWELKNEELATRLGQLIIQSRYFHQSVLVQNRQINRVNFHRNYLELESSKNNILDKVTEVDADIQKESLFILGVYCLFFIILLVYNLKKLTDKKSYNSLQDFEREVLQLAFLENPQALEDEFQGLLQKHGLFYTGQTYKKIAENKVLAQRENLLQISSSSVAQDRRLLHLIEKTVADAGENAAERGVSFDYYLADLTSCPGEDLALTKVIEHIYAVLMENIHGSYQQKRTQDKRIYIRSKRVPGQYQLSFAHALYEENKKRYLLQEVPCSFFNYLEQDAQYLKELGITLRVYELETTIFMEKKFYITLSWDPAALEIQLAGTPQVESIKKISSAEADTLYH